jgi:hypothetical protein
VELFSELGRKWTELYFQRLSAEDLADFQAQYAAHPWKTLRKYQERIVQAYGAQMTAISPGERRALLESLVPGFTSVDFQGGFVWGRAAFLAEIGKRVDEFGSRRV